MYLRELLNELSNSAASHQFLAVVPEHNIDDLSTLIDQKVIELIAYRSKLPGIVSRVYYDNIVLPRMIKRYHADILFSLTGFGSLRCPRSCKQVLLLPNNAYFCRAYRKIYQQFNKIFVFRRARKWMALLSIRVADAIILPTAAMKTDVQRHISLDGKDTAILHHGFSAKRFFDQPRNQKPPIIDDITQWQQQGYKIILHISSYAVHKNIETVIEALAQLPADKVKVKLVTTLQRDRTTDKAEYDRLISRIGQLGLADTVISAGHLTHNQVSFLYNAADVFVFPSCTESFGMPLVEAMAAGLPVVASDTAVHREVCNDAAVYFDTFDISDCRNHLQKVLTNSETRQAMSQRSLQRAKHFSWQNYVKSLLEIL